MAQRCSHFDIFSAAQSYLVLGAAVVCPVVCGGGLSDDKLAARLAAVGRHAVAAGDAVVRRGVGGPAVVGGLRRVLRLGLGPILEGEIIYKFEI